MESIKQLEKLIAEKEITANKWIFDYEDTVPLEALAILENTSKAIQNSLFRPIPKPRGNLTTQYTINQTCPICKRAFETYLNKSELLSIFTNARTVRSKKYRIDTTCPTCSKEKEKIWAMNQEEKGKIASQKHEEEKRERTKSYIDNYVSPDRVWTEGTKLYEKWRTINQSNLDGDTIAHHIKSMSYQDFLKTPYWGAIALKVKQAAQFKCKLCKSNKNIAAHHSIYDHHGYEHLYWKEDLICLCSNCHEKFHV